MAESDPVLTALKYDGKVGPGSSKLSFAVCIISPDGQRRKEETSDERSAKYCGRMGGGDIW